MSRASEVRNLGRQLSRSISGRRENTSCAKALWCMGKRIHVGNLGNIERSGPGLR